MTTLFTPPQHPHETHTAHGGLFLSDSGNWDRQHITDTFRWLNSPELFAESIRLFNANLGTEGKSQPQYREWLKHYRNWLGTRPQIQLPVTRPELRTTERQLPPIGPHIKEMVHKDWRNKVTQQFIKFRETGNIEITGAAGMYKIYVESGLIGADTYLRFREEAVSTVIAHLTEEAKWDMSKRHVNVNALNRIKGGAPSKEDEALIKTNCQVQAILSYYKHLIEKGRELKIK